jgi:hypothetical protein
MIRYLKLGALAALTAFAACGENAATPPAQDAGTSPRVEGGTSDGGTSPAPDAGAPPSDAGTAPAFSPGLQYNGSIAFERTSP